MVIATPIGNAGDITVRALDCLRAADIIACEDTRVTGSLMRRYGIDTPLTPYHEHNAARVRPLLIRRLEGGETVALVSDAGTPLVSDPGYKLVRACIDAAVPVTHLPGPSSVLTALVLSGLPSDRFLFCGFLPNRSKARRDALAEVAAVRATLIFLESPKRVAAALADMAEVLGDRPAAVTRELTKMFEEVRRGGLASLAADYGSAAAPKGEVTLVVGPPAEAAAVEGTTLDDELADALERLSLRDAVAEVAARLGMPRKAVYERALQLRSGG